MRSPSIVAVDALLTAFAAGATTPARAQYHPGFGHGASVRCESHYDGNRREFCPLPTRFGVHLSQQISRQPCVQGRNWFIAPRGVFVRGGCRAVFTANGPGGWHGHRPRPY